MAGKGLSRSCAGWTAALVLSLSWGVQFAARAESQATASEDAQHAAADLPDAKSILMRMAKFLAATPQFSVNLQSAYDVLQASGQMIEFNEQRTVVVRRPDHLRVDIEESDGARQLVVFDGKNISVLSTPQNVYAQAAKAGTIDDAVKYFLRDLKMRLPLAMMVVNTLPDEFARRATEVAYVEETSILGAPADHLAARTDTVDFQVWVKQGEQPLPLRVVLTYKTAPGAPQFSANFVDWNLAPQIDPAAFAFSAPKDARRIQFLPQLVAAGAPGGPVSAASVPQTTPDTGEQK